MKLSKKKTDYRVRAMTVWGPSWPITAAWPWAFISHSSAVLSPIQIYLSLMVFGNGKQYLGSIYSKYELAYTAG